MDDLLQDFIAETRETLEAIAGEIVAWEADPQDRGRLDAIFRFVHTVKGSCGFLDLPRLARLSHAAEDVLGEVRAGTRAADTALVSAVLGMIDHIAALVDAIETGTSLPDAIDQQLIAALHAPPVIGPAGGPAVFAPEASARAVTRTVRLPIDLLDHMMAGVSDMVLARNELARRLREGGADPVVEAAFDRLSVCVAEMRDAITRTRMQRIDTIFAGLPRLVRDLSNETGKRIGLEIEGGDVELDREMIEVIRDPLIHVLRNAVDHGLEPPDERRAVGKPATGRLVVSARQAGNQILIEVADDGRGIDADRVARKAVHAGLVSSEQVQAMPRARKVALIFAPGLSTADAVTVLSGRGVGMDVVRANVERIGGHVEVESLPGAGTRIGLRVPLTLSIIPALTLSAGGCHFAIPRAPIEEIVAVRGEQVRIDRIGGSEVATIRGRRLPVARLCRLLGLEERSADPPILVVLRPAGGATYALGLDAVHDHEELVVKPAAPPIMASGLYGGTTLPDNGQPMLLLDPAGIARAAGVPAAGLEREATPAEGPAETVPTLLFRDRDGIERGIRLGVVERIENAAAEAIVHRAGGMRLIRGDSMLSLTGCRPVEPACAATILRLTDGTTSLGYVIDTVLDIRDLSTRVTPAAVPGPIAGVVLVEGRPVELLDPFWLFAETAGEKPAPACGAPPLALRADADDAWNRDVLRPLIETAGYSVRFVGADERADLAIVGTADAGPTVTDAPVLRLRTQVSAGACPDSIYRYDRDALLGAVRACVGGS